MTQQGVDQQVRAEQVAAAEREKYERGGMSRENQLADLSARREASAQEMYESGRRERELKAEGKGGSDEYRQVEERHRQAEAQWNGLRKEEMRLNGKSVDGPESEYQYKHDRRNNFSYNERTIHTRNGDRTVRTAEGELGNPDTTINWRSETKVGAREARRTQGDLNKEKDQDAGHMVACRFGADPADAKNLGGQNFKQNQGGGTYHDAERQWADELRAHPDRKIRVCVEERYNAEKHGDRSVGRELTIDRSDPNGATREQRTFVNTPHYAKEGRGLRAEPREKPGDVHDIKTGRRLDDEEISRREVAAEAKNGEGQRRSKGNQPSELDRNRNTRKETMESKQEQQRSREQDKRQKEQARRQQMQAPQKDQDKAREQEKAKDQSQDGARENLKRREQQEQVRQQEQQRQRQDQDRQRQEKNRNAQQKREQQQQERQKLEREQKEKERKAKEEGREKKNRNAEPKQERQAQQQKQQQQREQQRSREQAERQQRQEQQQRQQEQSRSRSRGPAR